MRPYADIFKKPLQKEEVAAATRVLVVANSTSPSFLQRQLKIGFGKAATIIKLLKDAGVISKDQSNIILKNESMAVNAALRQLKRGKR